MTAVLEQNIDDRPLPDGRKVVCCATAESSGQTLVIVRNDRDGKTEALTLAKFNRLRHHYLPYGGGRI